MVYVRKRQGFLKKLEDRKNNKLQVIGMCEAMNPLVSVIIPTYNTKEQLIRECLQSVHDQIYRALEIVVVDDGSDDIHANMLDKLIAEMDDNGMIWTILHKVGGCKLGKKPRN